MSSRRLSCRALAIALPSSLKYSNTFATVEAKHSNVSRDQADQADPAVNILGFPKQLFPHLQGLSQHFVACCIISDSR